MTRTRQVFILIFNLLVLVLSGLVFVFFRDHVGEASPFPTQTYQSAPAESDSVSPEINAPLPKEVNLKIPFISQAPHANWDLPYKEFCEEASALMVWSYLTHSPDLGPDEADRKLLAIKNFEEKKFSFYEDTGAQETATILREHLGIKKVEILSNPTAQDIRRALLQKKAVIAPLSGMELNNPYYHQPAPLYHMLIIKGYRENGDFITHDPGSRRGMDYVYSEKTILDSLADWKGGVLDRKSPVVLIVG